MRIIKHGHACVSVVTGSEHVVVDPGMFTAPAALDGATAVLITHEHPDHWTAEHLARTDAPIHTIAAVAERIREADPALAERVSVVEPGDRVALGGTDGLAVTVVGVKHAVIHPDIPRITNVGYLVDGGKLFHPGDALTVPDHPVETLMLPVMAPWNKISEVIDYVREVEPQRAYDIHDALLTGLARPIYDRQIGDLGGAEHLRLGPGESAGL